MVGTQVHSPQKHASTWAQTSFGVNWQVLFVLRCFAWGGGSGGRRVARNLGCELGRQGAA